VNRVPEVCVAGLKLEFTCSYSLLAQRPHHCSKGVGAFSQTPKHFRMWYLCVLLVDWNDGKESGT
jgi:hypothetical protein